VKEEGEPNLKNPEEEQLGSVTYRFKQNRIREEGSSRMKDRFCNGFVGVAVR
jgi:hypothetical protein